MRTLLCAVALALPASAARFLHSIPEDTYAFPKFRVAFLNGLPVLNQTVHKWLAEGIRGGVPEFLDQPSQDVPLSLMGSGMIPASSPVNYSLEHMKMGSRGSYICLIPKPADSVASAPAEEPDAEITPAASWSLLQPLTGTCLYHRQGWFTYSYCHNEEIRQFKELTQAHLRNLGAYRPEEDPEWESYTLGRAPPPPEPGADLTVAEQDAHAVNLELARTAGSRYLVQRWGDGTLCDKTGRSREAEVQFHCSMATPDTILFVKEARTCSYVLVVQTPRLCGEPGFRSRHDTGEEGVIRCREVVSALPLDRADLPQADHPVKVPPRKAVPPSPEGAEEEEEEEEEAEEGDGTPSLEEREKRYGVLIKQTLEALLGSGMRPGTATVEGLPGEDEVTIEILDVSAPGEDQPVNIEKLVDALRTKGFDVDTGKLAPPEKKGEKKKPKKDRDEL